MENRKVRLIDANALMEDISESVVFTARGPFSPEIRGAHKITERIKAAPTINLGSLWPHAKWTKDHICTNCGESALEAPEAHCYYHTIYCPHCGAFMDKED